ncbi:MAG: hypothetical protein ACFCVF_09835 [Kineosporiaceae bacterium]
MAGLLKQHLARYEADTVRIVRRVQDELAAERALRLRARRVRIASRRTLVAAFAAAGVAAVIVVGTPVLRLNDGGSISPAISPTQAPTPSITRSTGADEASASAALSVVSARPSSTTVRISGFEVDDFVVAGVDETDAFVTARRNVTTQVLSSGAVGDPVSATEAGPFTITWDGGQAPYASGTTRDWFVVRPTPGGPDSGAVVQAVGATSGADIVVHVGVAGPAGRIEALVGDNVQARQVLPGGGSDFELYTVTVTINEADASDDVVAVRILAPDGGAVGLAAAEVDGP